MRSRYVRLLGQASAIALMSCAVASPAQATWFTTILGVKPAPKPSPCSWFKPCSGTPTPRPTPHPTPTPTPTPTPHPTPTPPPPPPPSSTGGATDVPEPDMLGLFGLGVAGLVVSRQRRAKKARQQG